MSATHPTLAIIIPARDEAAVIGACLRSIATQGWPADRLEVLVIDDGSRDDTGAIARAAGATVLRTEGVGPSRGRNLALARTRAELCLFTDADCELTPGFLETLVAALGARGPAFAGVGGRQAAPPDDPPYAQRVQRFLEAVGFVSEYVSTDERPRETRHNPSCCALRRRDAVLEAGGFRDDLWPCEDVELDLALRRRGLRLLYEPRALVLHHRPADAAAFARMMRNYGRGHGALVRLRGLTRALHLMPLVTLATLGLAPAAMVATAPLWLRWRLGAAWRTGAEVAALRGMLATALWQWHRGFVEGLRGRSAIAPASPPRAGAPPA
jgi:cellulose synthase/poly-beta-1,6-N-acetylglucosamine synthase-like glycosyltransferase